LTRLSALGVPRERGGRVAIPDAVGGCVRKLWLSTEFALLYCLLPALIVLLQLPPQAFLPGLLVGAVACTVVLLRDPTFDRRRLWEGDVAWRHVARVAAIFLIGVAVLTAVAMTWFPERFLEFPRNNPGRWRLVMILYPLLSVAPQGIIWRTFLFHRYRELFGQGRLVVVVAALAFAWVHVIFENWIALALTLAGGFLFAWTYRQSRSNFLASFEHALYGCLVFTLGFGRFLYGGVIR
jgi:membrane protease YdiL (CAAX protease family)